MASAYTPALTEVTAAEDPEMGGAEMDLVDYVSNLYVQISRHLNPPLERNANLNSHAKNNPVPVPRFLAAACPSMPKSSALIVVVSTTRSTAAQLNNSLLERPQISTP